MANANAVRIPAIGVRWVVTCPLTCSIAHKVRHRKVRETVDKLTANCSRLVVAVLSGVGREKQEETIACLKLKVINCALFVKCWLNESYRCRIEIATSV